MPSFVLHRDTPLTTGEVSCLPGGAVPVRGEGDIVARARFRSMPTEAMLRMAFSLGQAAPGSRLVVALEDAPAESDDAADEANLWASPAEETQEEPFDTGEIVLPAPEPTEEIDLEPTVDAPTVQPDLDADDEDTAPIEAVESDTAPFPPPDATPPPTPPDVADGPPPAPSTALAKPGEPAPTGDPWDTLAGGDSAGAMTLFEHQGLDSDGRARVRSLLQSTDPEEVTLGCQVAHAARWRSSVQTMRRLLQHSDTRVRQAAVVAVGDLAGPALVPSVRMLLRDASPGVRGAAVAALMKLESR